MCSISLAKPPAALQPKGCTVQDGEVTENSVLYGEDRTHARRLHSGLHSGLHENENFAIKRFIPLREIANFETIFQEGYSIARMISV